MASTLTPNATARAVKVKGSGGREFWKQIIPNTQIHYTDPATGIARVLDFNAEYHKDVKQAFREQSAIDQVCFQLADSRNRHGRDFDPERQRGEVLDMATLDELPAAVRAKLGAEAQPGLYARIRMFNDKAAQLIRDNPKLGVSARIKENYEHPGTKAHSKRAAIHILGTIDPRAPKMAPWTEVDLTGYPDLDDVTLDLSNSTYQEAATVAGGKNKTKDKTKTPADAHNLPDDLTELSDEDLRELATSLDIDVDALMADLEAGPGDEDEDDESGEDDPDEDQEPTDPPDGELVGAGAGNGGRSADLTTGGRVTRTREYDLAVAAGQRADEALQQLSDERWTRERDALLGAGVPAAAIDLAAPYCSAAGGFTVDLSNGDEQDVAGDFRKLLALMEGTVDLTAEQGYGGTHKDGQEGDPDQPVLDAWERQFPV